MFAPGPTSQRQYAKGVGGVFVVFVTSLLLISTWRTLNLEALGQFQKSSMTNAQPPVLDAFEKRTFQDGVLSQWFNDEAVFDTEDPLLFFTAEQSGLEGPSNGLSQNIKNLTNPKERPLNHEFIIQITENTLVPKCVEMQAQVRLIHRI
jgi:hypothetical protein